MADDKIMPGDGAAPPNMRATNLEQMHGAHLPAPYINRWVVASMTDEPLIRITFGEAVNADKHFHFAMMISKANAKWLAQMILDTVSENQGPVTGTAATTGAD